MNNNVYFLAIFSILWNVSNAQQFSEQYTGLGTLGRTSPYHMIVVDENTVWASSSSLNLGKFDNVPNSIVHTEDGGMTWEIHTLPVSDPDDFYVACISAVGSDSAWVSSIDKYSASSWEFEIYATFDGGESWEIQDVPFADDVHYGGQIHFFNHLEGIIIAGNANGIFQIFRTSDGGDTWAALPTGDAPQALFNEIDIDNGLYAIEDTIWVGTTQGRVLKSNNRGKTWRVFDTPASNTAVFEISFSNSQYGLARYSFNSATNANWNTNNLMMTTDGGESWEIISPQGLEDKIFDLNSVPGQTGTYLCTSHSGSALSSNKLYYSRDNGATWIELELDGTPGRIALLNSAVGWISEIGTDKPDVDLYKMEGLATSNKKIIMQGISVFPNPFEESLLIKNENRYKIESITIFDILGRRVVSSNIDSDTAIHLENTSQLEKGIYVLRVKFDKGFYTGKIIKD